VLASDRFISADTAAVDGSAPMAVGPRPARPRADHPARAAMALPVVARAAPLAVAARRAPPAASASRPPVGP
jgi:hypothetical protein